MKTKLTITIDSDLLPRAKRYARARGVSLSSLVEDALRELAAEEAPSFVDRWRGRFEPASKKDERFMALAKKYL
jgi:post-segregation antitoxin (ccd killing protein)